MTLRRFLFISQAQTAIAHTFNSVLWYDWNLSTDKIWQQTRQIQRGRAYNFDGANDRIDFNWFDSLGFLASWKFTIDVRCNFTTTANFPSLFHIYQGAAAASFFYSVQAWRPEIYYYMNPTNAASQFRIVRTAAALPTNVPVRITLSYDDAINTNNGVDRVKIYVNWSQVSVVSWWSVWSLWTINKFDTLPTFWSVLNNYFYRWQAWDLKLANSVMTPSEIDNSTNLWAHYKMDEGNGTIAYDSSGNNRHGVLVNGVAHTTFTNGNGADYQNQVWYTDNAWVLIPRNEAIPTQDVLGNALQYTWRVKYNAQLWGRYYSFDGTNDRVQMPVTTAYHLTNFTISLWFVQTAKVNTRLRSYDWWAPRKLISIKGRGLSNRLEFGLWITTLQQLAWPVLETWRVYHLTAVRQAWIEIRLYLDGVLVGSQVSTQLWPIDVPWSPTLWSYVSASEFYDWQMRDVRVYNVAKNDAEVAAIYNWAEDMNGIVSIHNLSEWAGTIAYDSSGNWHHADLINGVSHWSAQWRWSTARQRYWYTPAMYFTGTVYADYDAIVFWTADFSIKTTINQTRTSAWLHDRIASNAIDNIPWSRQLAIDITTRRLFFWPWPWNRYLESTTALQDGVTYNIEVRRSWWQLQLLVNNVIESTNNTLYNFSHSADLRVWYYYDLAYPRWGSVMDYLWVISSLQIVHWWTTYDINYDTIKNNNWVQRHVVPRNENNTSQDVLGNPLQYVWDNQSLLPWWRVNFDPAPAPELIRLWVDQDYSYWDTLPASMTKTVEWYKEKDFIIDNP